jgi:hypothetical protein
VLVLVLVLRRQSTRLPRWLMWAAPAVATLLQVQATYGAFAAVLMHHG